MDVGIGKLTRRPSGRIGLAQPPTLLSNPFRLRITFIWKPASSRHRVAKCVASVNAPPTRLAKHVLDERLGARIFCGKYTVGRLARRHSRTKSVRNIQWLRAKIREPLGNKNFEPRKISPL
jgi:hypothetical protein